MSKTILITRLSRHPKSDPSDEIKLTPGVNVIVGASNTGKTQWLKTIDYLMGDKDKTEDALEMSLVEKYDSVSATLLIGEKEVHLERRWKEPGKKGAVYVNGEPMRAEDLSDFLLTQLEMPLMTFPSGGPLSLRGWPSLTWRVLLRHIYRRGDSWGDFATKQPESEQRACLLYFTGMSDTLFSDERRQLAESERLYNQRQVEKNLFMSQLQRFAGDLLDEQDLASGITPLLIAKAVVSAEEKMRILLEQRDQRITALQSASQTSLPTKEVERLKVRWAELQNLQQTNQTDQIQAESRLADLAKYQEAVNADLQKLERAASAGQVFSDLKISHCPACHKPLRAHLHPNGTCFLCKQPDDSDPHQEVNSRHRLEFEQAQLRAEQEEAQELVDEAMRQVESLILTGRHLESEQRHLDLTLRPIRQGVSALRDEMVSLLDQEYGQLKERIAGLERLATTLGARSDFDEELTQIASKIQALQQRVEYASVQTDRYGAEDVLRDGIIEYLSAIRKLNSNSWALGLDVQVRLRERTFAVLLNGQSWNTKLGDTQKLYFLLAYNYALLKLTARPWAHYPGLTILDLPPKLEDGDSVADRENFAIMPFVELTGETNMPLSQVIVTGSAFKGLEGVNRVQLITVWK